MGHGPTLRPDVTSARESLFDHARREQIRELVTRWISIPDEQAGRLPAGLTYPIPASPDDVYWLLDVIEAMRGLLIEADSAISHQFYRGSWPLERHETDRLIASLRTASK
jgi:hypothetical protein